MQDTTPVIWINLLQQLALSQPAPFHCQKVKSTANVEPDKPRSVKLAISTTGNFQAVAFAQLTPNIFDPGKHHRPLREAPWQGQRGGKEVED